MHIMVIGDVGWSDFYHLGDEAMTEFALQALTTRGVERITLVAGEPEYAAELYGVDSVPRLGFSMKARTRNAARAEKILAFARGDDSALAPTDTARDTVAALRSADALLVAGGGNLNSMFDHHVHDRSTLAALAREFGIPYALTSQTLGPLVIDEDRPQLTDLFAGAVVVGAREDHTDRAVRALLGPDTGRVVRQTDDAWSLTARPEDHAAMSDWTAGGEYIVLSLAERPSSPVISWRTYWDMNVELCRRIRRATGMRLLLVPHAGAFEGSADAKQDQVTNARCVAAVGDPDVVATEQVTARELVALTSRARAVVGTRYHAGILAAAAAVPHVSLAPNMYSSVRMRGAARNVGTEQFVLPYDDLDAIVRTVRSIAVDGFDRTAALDHLARVSRLRTEEHRAHWDFVVDSLRGGGSTPATHAPVDVLENRTEGADPRVALARLDVVEAYGRKYQELSFDRGRHKAAAEAARADLDRLRAKEAERAARAVRTPGTAGAAGAIDAAVKAKRTLKLRTCLGRAVRRLRGRS
ncbi:polysaccharide pyruvyl transferase family protein [Brevibacterium litoralis]|uniref:polysaccharide pyruvyl transferase family protein n=1 Tax=Brevibacterium litoralis TaxID=3138935 RepID=UPI0032EC32C8